MNHVKTLLLGALFCAAGASAADVEVSKAWARGTVPAQTMSGAFMEIGSKRGAALVGASTPAAEVVEVHEMKLEGGVMKMRATPRLDLPAGKTVTLKPGGYHLMLMGLKRQLKAGETLPLSLSIEDRDGKVQKLDVTAEVRALGQGGDAASAGHHHHHH